MMSPFRKASYITRKPSLSKVAYHSQSFPATRSNQRKEKSSQINLRLTTRSSQTICKFNKTKDAVAATTSTNKENLRPFRRRYYIQAIEQFIGKRPSTTQKPTVKFCGFCDYKKRFVMLKEEHVKLKTKYIEMKAEVESVSAKINNYDEMEMNLLELKKSSEVILKKGEEVALVNEKLKEKYENLVSEHEELTKRYGSVLEALRNVEKVHERIRAKNMKAERDLKIALEDITTRDKLIETLKQKWLDMDDMRKKLHNEVQNLKGNIRVFCRIRPSTQAEKKESICNIVCEDECTLGIKKNNDSEAKRLEFTFDRVFLAADSQEVVFKELSPLIQSALDGYNVCVFAYGQTGSGKTYTMQGGDTPETSGVIPRSVDLLFQNIASNTSSGWTFKVVACFFEIYNEMIKDLLDPQSKTHHNIRYNDGKGITITNLTEEIIDTAEGLKELMLVACRNRAKAATNFNVHSSRSHAVTKITMKSANHMKTVTYNGSLTFVDLAGSECAKTSVGTRLAETKCINKSLSALGNVMLALLNKKAYVPYRNSKLTYMLQSSLGGNSKTLMIVNISPLEKTFGESLSSLRFAAQAKEVTTTVKRNKNNRTASC